MTTLRSILLAYPIWLPVLVLLLASLATRLTAYPRAAGLVTGLRVVLDVLSIWQHKDSPGGAWQLPLVERSIPPDGVKQAAMSAAPLALLAVLLLGGCGIASEVATIGLCCLVALVLLSVRASRSRVFWLLPLLLLGGCDSAARDGVVGAAVGVALICAVWYAVARMQGAPRPRDRHGNPLGPAVLVVLLVPSLAFADGEVTPDEGPKVVLAPAPAPLRAPLVLPTIAAPDPAPVPAMDLASKLQLAHGQLDALALQLGIPMPAKIPVQFWDTPAGKGITITLTVLGGLLAAGQTAAVIYTQVR